MIVELVATAVGVSGATVVAVWPSRDRLMRRRLRETVVVTLKTGAAFKGALFEADARSFVLRNAELLGRPDVAPIPVDGELMVARADVEYVQRP